MNSDGTLGIARDPKRIRVLHVVPSVFGQRFGGHTHYLYSLLSGWRDRDITLDLWGPRVKPLNINSGNLAYQLPEGVQLWADARVPGRLGRSRAAARMQAEFVSRRDEFDIVHFHFLWWGELLSPVVLHSMGKKVVFTMSLYGNDNPGTIAAERGALALSLLRRFDGFVALSPALAEDCRHHGMSNVLCLPNFLAIPELAAGRDDGLRSAMRVRHHIPPEDAVLLFIGAAIRRKGLDILVESYLRVAERHPRAWLVLVGPCSVAEAGAGFDLTFVDGLRHRLHEARLSDRVIWTGMVTDRRELVGYYSAADIFVFPTRREGSPNVLVEAMAAGLPVVATNLPGCTDNIVVDGEDGFLVPAEDSGALARALDRLIADPALRAKMGISGRKRSGSFGFESYCRKLKGFYLNTMKTRPR
jgi:glycosyltransferase involved in cell wall biosynthesis